jgi:hypothetical protein
VSGSTVIYSPEYVSDVNEAKKATNFSYTWGPIVGDPHDGGIPLVPLSYYINGSASATISNGKVTINLGTPKSYYMKDFVPRDGVTLTPSNAKLFTFADSDSPQFYTSGGQYFLYCIKGSISNYVNAQLVYVDKDITMTGTDSYLTTYDVSMEKGWNYLIFSSSSGTTFTSSTTLPSGFNWIVGEY